MRTLIVACNYREAVEVARSRNLAAKDWQYVATWNDVRGLRRPRVLRACLPDDWYAPRWMDVRQALAYVEAEIEHVGCPYKAPHAIAGN